MVQWNILIATGWNIFSMLKFQFHFSNFSVAMHMFLWQQDTHTHQKHYSKSSQDSKANLSIDVSISMGSFCLEFRSKLNIPLFNSHPYAGREARRREEELIGLLHLCYHSLRHQLAWSFFPCVHVWNGFSIRIYLIMFIFGFNRTNDMARALDDVAVQLTVAARALQTCVQIIENRQMLVQH